MFVVKPFLVFSVAPFYLFPLCLGVNTLMSLCRIPFAANTSRNSVSFGFFALVVLRKLSVVVRLYAFYPELKELHCMAHKYWRRVAAVVGKPYDGCYPFNLFPCLNLTVL